MTHGNRPHIHGFMQTIATAITLIMAFTTPAFCTLAHAHDPEPDPCAIDRDSTECAARLTEGVAPYEEYHKRTRTDEIVTPLSSEVFGDSVSLYNGSTQFSVVDIDLPGNSTLPMQLRRTFKVETRKGAPLGFFGVWDLDIPHLSGVFDAEFAWTIGQSGQPTPRCSSMFYPAGRPNLAANEIWTGTYLHLPGEGDRELLWRDQPHPVPADGHTYRWITRDDYRLRCVPSVTDTHGNSYPGEGFLAIDREGTKYTFDVATHRYHSSIVKSPYLYQRVRVFLLASRVEDRHGNWVRYHYADGRLTQITSNDGRVITLQHEWDPAHGGYHRIVSASAHGRTWTYGYGLQTMGAPARRLLTTVSLPDGSGWGYQYTGPLIPVYETDPDLPLSCNPPQTNGNGEDFTLTATHPAGVRGRFVFHYRRHYRSGVPANTCVPPQYQVTMPNTADVYSLISKTLDSVGVPTQTWSFDYAETPYPRAEFATPWCQTCQQFKDVTVTAPDAGRQRYRYGVVWNHNDGRLLGTTTLTPGNSVLRDEAHTYVAENEIGSMPFPGTVGTLSASDDPAAVRLRPVKHTVIQQQGVNFTWTVNGAGGFNAYAQPVNVTRASSLGYSTTEQMAYENNTARWVIGQLKSIRDTGSGLYPEQTTYDPVSMLPTHRYAFGALTERRTYHADGRPWQVYDGSNVKKTTLASYKRGIPRTVTYHDGTGETAVVNDWGEITAITSPMGHTTQYAYDPMGRLKQITYPAGDSVAWADTFIDIEQVPAVEYGLPAGHWRQTIRTGNARTITYYDGLWRPVLTRTFDASDEANTRRMVQRRFDHAGRTTLVSFPQRTIAAYNSGVDSTTTQYDALGRVTQTQSNSELGLLTTTTAYVASFRTQVTDPRGHVTTTRYQAFDQPVTDASTQIDHPEGITTTISRDVFGKATAITRSGLYAGSPVSATRRYVYDTQQRLCKRIDPETAATVMDYDASHNLTWSATGLNLQSTTDCQRGSVPANEKSTRSYDGRNRLTAVNYPGGAASVSYSYFADGALKTLTSAGSTWTYGYSKRRLLDTETLSLDGASYTLKHGWNATGHRSQLTYPDNVIVPFAPNALGEPTRAGNYATAVKRHPAGTPETFAYGNGIAYSQTLNTRQLPQHRIELDGNLKLADFLLGYDENANLTVIGDNSLAQPDSVEGLNAGPNLTAVEDRLLAYDGLNRLIQAHAPDIFGNETYAYDPLDNIRKVVLGAGPGALTLDYSYGQNRLTQLKLSQNGQQLIHSYTHNARGHMTKRGDQQHAFDAAGRMTAAITGQESYRYDGHGRRTVRQGPTGERTVTLYSQSGQLLYETRTPGQVSCAPANDRLFCHGFDPPSGPSTSTRYVYLDNRLVAQHSTNTITYLHTDQLGSVTMRTNAQRQVLSRALYEPYGSLAVGSIQQGPGVSFPAR